MNEIILLVEKYPRLTSHGYAFPGESSVGGLNDKDYWDKCRNELSSQGFADQVRMAQSFISACCRYRGTFNRKISSYGWKHQAEIWLRDNPGFIARHAYVSNGAFIAAALLEGYSLSGLGNVYFNMSGDGL